MGIKEDVIEMQKELQDVKQESFTFEILKDYKKQNKRLFAFGLTISIILSIMLSLSIGYIVYLLNDIEVITTEEIIDIEEVETIDNSDIQIGDR